MKFGSNFLLRQSIGLILFFVKMEIKSLLIISNVLKFFLRASVSLRASSFSNIDFDLSKLSIKFKASLAKENHHNQMHHLFLFQTFFFDFPFQQKF